MTTSLKILNIKTLDSSPAILLVSPDGSKILVNCGVGTQRSFLEFQQRIATVKAICLTKISHDTIGGLPGMILTAADIHAKPENNLQIQTNLHLIGPTGTQAFIEAIRHFVRRDQFKIKVHEGNCTVDQLSHKRKRQDEHGDGFAIKSQPFQEETTKLLSYLFYTRKQPGKFDIKRATEIGIPPGPLYGKLKAGHTITFASTDGKTITVEPQQVVGTSIAGRAAIILQYPTKEKHLERFLEEMRLVQYAEEKSAEVEIVVHLATRHLVNAPVARDWRKAHEVKHLWINTDTEQNGFVSPYRSAILGAFRRSLVSDLYSIPRIDDAQQGKESNDIMSATPMMEFVMLPLTRQGFNNESAPTPIGEEMKKIREEPEVREASKAAEHMLKDRSSQSNMIGGKASLLFTGTGSAIPCKHRNVTGMCLTAETGKCMLLDCGEGTIGQILRVKGIESTFDLSSIATVWISHPHADHHLDIIRLLEERSIGEPLCVIAPKCIFDFLHEYSAIETCPSLGPYTGVLCEEVVSGSRVVDAHMAVVHNFGSLRAIPVTHCRDSYAVSIESTPFGKVVYSGDCRPSRRLAELTKPVDLLIHEATFEDGMEAEAALKNHCTVGEALKIANEMKAKFTCLTHFSQRYPKIQPVPAEEAGETHVIFAFDLLSILPLQLLSFSLLTPALRLLYTQEAADNMEEDEEVLKIMSTPGAFAREELL